MAVLQSLDNDQLQGAVDGMKQLQRELMVPNPQLRMVAVVAGVEALAAALGAIFRDELQQRIDDAAEQEGMDEVEQEIEELGVGDR